MQTHAQLSASLLLPYVVDASYFAASVWHDLQHRPYRYGLFLYPRGTSELHERRCSNASPRLLLSSVAVKEEMVYDMSVDHDGTSAVHGWQGDSESQIIHRVVARRIKVEVGGYVTQN